MESLNERAWQLCDAVEAEAERLGVAEARQMLDAVVRGANGEPVVWRHTDPERFEARPVRTEPFDAVRLVISAGVFAATSADPNLMLVILSSAAGAFIGDHISYFIGRHGGARLVAKAGAESRSRKAFDWAARTLYKRGGLILVIARYVPFGRTATTLTCGTVRYPLKKFTFFDALAALMARMGIVFWEVFFLVPPEGAIIPQ